MRLATIRRGDRTAAVRVEGDTAVELGVPDVRAVLERPAWSSWVPSVEGPRHPLAALDWAPLVPSPSKIVCVGLNYRSHILEMGRELPTDPTLFAKFADTLLGAHDDLVLPANSEEVDWEAELGVVVGAPVRHASTDQAAAAIAGYTVLNDVSMRDWQWRTTQWLSGKVFEASTPVGPCLVTPDEVGNAADLALRCEVDGRVMQSSRTSDLLFGPAELVAYVSRITTLRPGDLIATGTPGGVGAARTPKVFLAPGQVLRTVIEGIGECVNTCVAAPRATATAVPALVEERR
ncbi:MAG TPA: fumarylacetoacetate hydrolase family protein [Candidatus Dormibacteraeota bacterium]|nr:fumarylacetoacetate hydrolase family protein [Candidatus Dormibacteraeota bacterium]